MDDVLADPSVRFPDEARASGHGAPQQAAAPEARQPLLDFSRIEAGRVEARYDATELAALTTDLASNFRSTIDRAGLRLRGRTVRRCRTPSTSIATCGRRSFSTSSRTRSSSRSTARSACALRRQGDCVGSTVARHRHRDRPKRDFRASSSDSIAGRAPSADARGHGHRSGARARARASCTAAPSGRAASSAGHDVDRARPAAARTAPPAQLVAPYPRRTTALGNRAPFRRGGLGCCPTQSRGAGTASAASRQTSAPPSARRWRGPEVAVEGGARILLVDDNADMRRYVRRHPAASSWRVETGKPTARAALAEAARSHVPDLVSRRSHDARARWLRAPSRVARRAAASTDPDHGVVGARG